MSKRRQQHGKSLKNSPYESLRLPCTWGGANTHCRRLRLLFWLTEGGRVHFLVMVLCPLGSVFFAPGDLRLYLADIVQLLPTEGDVVRGRRITFAPLLKSAALALLVAMTLRFCNSRRRMTIVASHTFSVEAGARESALVAASSALSATGLFSFCGFYLRS